jgi:hypothetical protein
MLFKEGRVMLEWIAGDSLVGILTKIGFFTFLIIGRTVKLRRVKDNQPTKPRFTPKRNQ